MDVLNFVNGAMDSLERYSKMACKLEHGLLNTEELTVESITTTFENGDYQTPHIKLTLRATLDEDTKKVVCEFLGVKAEDPHIIFTTMYGDTLTTRTMHIESNAHIVHTMTMNYIKNTDLDQVLMVKVHEAYRKATERTTNPSKSADGTFTLTMDKQEYTIFTCNGKDITEETYRMLSDTNIPGVDLRADVYHRYSINGREVTVDIYGKVLDICSSIQN